MTLTRSAVEQAAREYRDREPLYAVEREQIETLPAAFADGRFGRRDAAWVVRWYYRRFLGAYPDAARRDAETAFRENDFEAVRDALVTVATGSPTAVEDHLNRLSDLDGVDVPVGSAFLAFTHPDCVVVGPRVWAAMVDAGELTGSYPASPTVADYRRYLDACLDVADRVDSEPWTLYRAMWRLAPDDFDLRA